MLLLQDHFKIVIPCSQQNNIPSDKNHFQDFPSKEKKMLHYAFGHDALVMLCFAMLPLTQSTQKTRIWDSTTHSPRFGAKKNEIYYSLLLFICHYSLSLFTCYYSLRIFAYLRGVVPYISSKFLVCLVQDFFHRESFHL